MTIAQAVPNGQFPQSPVLIRLEVIAQTAKICATGKTVGWRLLALAIGHRMGLSSFSSVASGQRAFELIP